MGYFEVDFPQVAMDKIKVVKKEAALKELCFQGENGKVLEDEEGNVKMNNFAVIGADLTKTGELEEKLRSFGFDLTLPTVVLCECSLTYVEANSASVFYRWLAASICDVHLIVYEQVQWKWALRGSTLCE